MKRLTTNIKKLYKLIDISPFSFGKIKFLIFLFWGLNALAFLNRESIVEHNVSPEQLIVVSREYFDYNIATDYIDTVSIDLEPCIIGIVKDSGFNTPNPVELKFNSSRAPPAIS